MTSLTGESYTVSKTFYVDAFNPDINEFKTITLEPGTICNKDGVFREGTNGSSPKYKCNVNGIEFDYIDLNEGDRQYLENPSGGRKRHTKKYKKRKSKKTKRRLRRRN